MPIHLVEVKSLKVITTLEPKKPNLENPPNPTGLGYNENQVGRKVNVR